MIHIDLQIGLKCVSDPGHPNKFQFGHIPGALYFDKFYFFTPLSRSQFLGISTNLYGEHRLIVLLVLKSGCLLIIK